MRNRRAYLVACTIIGSVSCGAETGAPSATQPAKAPVATPSPARPSRPPPNCKRGPEEDGGVAIPTAAAGDAGSALPISDADRVIASLRGQFRACYQKGLQIDAELDGCVVLSAKVGPEGSVSSSEAVITDRLSPEVIACLAGVVRTARFTAPVGGGSTLRIPITFMQQQSQPLPKTPPLTPPGPQPTGALPGAIAGFRFGMTPAEFRRPLPCGRQAQPACRQ